MYTSEEPDSYEKWDFLILKWQQNPRHSKRMIFKMRVGNWNTRIANHIRNKGYRVKLGVKDYRYVRTILIEEK